MDVPTVLSVGAIALAALPHIVSGVQRVIAKAPAALVPDPLTGKPIEPRAHVVTREHGTWHE